MSRPRDQGTRFESWLVDWLKRISPWIVTAYRLAEGGSNDEGDVRFVDAYDEEWTVECKATQTLNVTRVLGKARAKSPAPATTVLFWKRLTKSTPEAKRRTPDGEPVVVVMGLDTFALLMGRHPDD
jgi:hypothetical protein